MSIKIYALLLACRMQWAWAEEETRRLKLRAEYCCNALDSLCDGVVVDAMDAEGLAVYTAQNQAMFKTYGYSE